jgi:hypothetical protein
MDAKTITKYRPYADLTMQLDMLRAGKFVNPVELRKNLETPELDAIVREQIKRWDWIMEILDKAFTNKLPWLKLVDGLRWFEVPTLTTYLFVIVLAIFQKVPWAMNISTPVSIVVFIYLAITRVSITVLVDNKATQLLKQFSSSYPHYQDKLHNAANQIIDALDTILLDLQEGGSDFRLRLRQTDYIGVTYIMKPSKLGPEMLDAYPFPFQPKLNKAKTSVRIIMARRDDKLIQALAEVPQNTDIQMVITHLIADQKSFPKFIVALKKLHARCTSIEVDQIAEVDGVIVLLKDSTWKLDTRAASGYLRLPYLPVEDGKEQSDYNNIFTNLWNGNELPASS